VALLRQAVQVWSRAHREFEVGLGDARAHALRDGLTAVDGTCVRLGGDVGRHRIAATPAGHSAPGGP
jgi:hypothetical protein